MKTTDTRPDIPKLRKCWKHQLRWGTEYFNALKEIVFTVEPKAYAPAELPEALREANKHAEPHNMCKQCGDSFLLKSSLNGHEKRMSFILGYWCVHCFSVQCLHSPEGQAMCSLCKKIEIRNRARLNRRGLKRGHKMGSVKVFYNQCEFFGHLREHNLNAVDMAYLMLMPVPAEFEACEMPQLNDACKAVMEHAFIKQKHIVDILNSAGDNSKWWMSEPSDATPIGELLNAYLVDSCDEHTLNTADNSDDSAGETLNNFESDSPITRDITFVDCGSPVKPDMESFVPSDMIMPSDSSHQISLLKPVPVKIPSLETLKKNFNKLQMTSSGVGIGNSSEYNKNFRIISMSSENTRSKVTIIKKDLTKSSDAGALFAIKKMEASHPEASKMVNAVMTPNASASKFAKIAARNPKQLMKLPTGETLVLQNGKKYIIRQIANSNLVAQSTQNPVDQDKKPAASNYQQPKVIPQLISASLKNRKIQLPKSCLSCDYPTNDNSSNVELGTKGLQALRRKYSLDLRKKLLNHSKQKIQGLVQSATEFSKEIAKCSFVDTEAISKRNLTAVKLLRGYLDTAENEVEPPEEERINNEFKNRLTTWAFQKETYDVCSACNKRLKPKKYLIGISKATVYDDIFCQCHNFICHLCKAKQGNAARYKEHIKFHLNQAPYKCPECFTVFPNMQNLEIHIWTKCFHLYTQEIFSCTICDMDGFLTLEMLSRHYYEFHSKTVIVCPLCPITSTSYAQFLAHHAKCHAGIKLNADPDSLIICDFGGCLVSPEKFGCHMENHREIGRTQYYTCPFCAFFVKGIKGKENIIQDHVFMQHSDRLSEIVTPETLNFFASSFNLKVQPQLPVERDKSREILLPKIVNACSIAPTAFEQVSTAAPTTTHKIIKLNLSHSVPTISTEMTIPKIVNVQSMNPIANNLINNTTTTKQNYALQTLQSGKVVAVPITYVTNSITQKRPILLKVNLFDKNRNQVENKPDGLTNTPAISKSPTCSSSTDNLAFKQVTALPQLINSELNEKPNPPVEKKSNDEGISDNSIAERKPNSEDSAVFSDMEQDKQDEVGVSGTFGPREVDNELFKSAAEALKRRGRPKKPWRIALDGSEDLKCPPLNFKCHLCYENITTAWEVIKHHFAVRHFREYKLCMVTPRLEKITYSEELDSTKIEDTKKRKAEPSSSPRGAARRKRRPTIKMEDNNSRLGVHITQERLEEIEGSFTCKKCEGVFEDVTSLRVHFANKHRIKDHFLVCLECGENFVVANSLQMHLKAFHGISDTVSYLAQNALYAPDIGGSLDTRTSEPNQCYVCMAVFEDKSAVDKHLRVHGMAFLNHTSEARSAMKVDEKKSEDRKPEGRQLDNNADNSNTGGSIIARISMLLS